MLASPDTCLNRRPNSLRNLVDLGPNTLVVSIATGVKTWHESRCLYFCVFSSLLHEQLLQLALQQLQSKMVQKNLYMHPTLELYMQVRGVKFFWGLFASLFNNLSMYLVTKLYWHRKLKDYSSDTD